MLNRPHFLWTFIGISWMFLRCLFGKNGVFPKKTRTTPEQYPNKGSQNRSIIANLDQNRQGVFKALSCKKIGQKVGGRMILRQFDHLYIFSFKISLLRETVRNIGTRQVAAMKAALEKLKAAGVNSLNDEADGLA